MRRRRVVAVTLLIYIILSTGVLWVRWQHYLQSVVTVQGQAQTFEVRSGSSIISLANQLQADGIIKHPKVFVWVFRLRFATHVAQAGQYRITAGTTVAQLAAMIVQGRVLMHALTIIPGWTFSQLIREINRDPYLSHQLRGVPASAVMRRLGVNLRSPEGQFYPDTYLYGAGISDVELLRKAHHALQQILTQQWQQRSQHLPYKTPYQALIVASMIQKEAKLASDAPKIAGVIVRRLRKRMALQIDPTVIYALGDRFQGALSAQDLTLHSPYNTYRHKGLPPTPIAMPGLQAIFATLHPAGGKALYYVAKGDGSHQFSETLTQHNRAVKRYWSRVKRHFYFVIRDLKMCTMWRWAFTGQS